MLTKTKKIIAILSVVSILLLSFLILFFNLDISKKNNLEMNEIVSASITSDILEDKSYISEQEKKNVNALFLSSNNDSMLFDGNTYEVERYLTLKDIDDSYKYLYVEYDNNGFAIYDRQQEFMYESSLIGAGPYDEFNNNNNLYYFGPTQFYIKQEDNFKHIVTDEICSYEEAEEKSVGVQNIREKYENNETNAVSLRNISTYANNRTFYLGENMKDDNLYKTDVSLYFTILSIYEQTNKKSGYNTAIELNLDCNPHRKFRDMLYGHNKYGSCTYVALSAVMMFYERLAVKDFLPNDIKNFEIMYNNTFYFDNDWFGARTVRLNSVDKNLLPSEVLHQELLCIAFPEKKGTTSNTSSFGESFSDAKKTYNKYIEKYNLDKVTFKMNLGTSFLPETIVSGNPAMVGISNGYPHSSSKNDAHAVICYGFNGSHGLWYGIDSAICNYCWDTTYTGCVSVNKEFIDDYAYINVF